MGLLTADAVVFAIGQVLGDAKRPVPLHEPVFGPNDLLYVKECIETGWVSSVGSYVDRFERMLAETCGTKYAVAVVNGTAALHVALLLAGVQPGDEVLVPPLTFVATANAVHYAGAIPHFVEVSETTFGIDPAALDAYLETICEMGEMGALNRLTGRRIAAVVPVHVFGHPVDMDRLAEVATRFRLEIVEDAAEALGSAFRGRPCGSMGKISALSFNGNKIATSGGGGAILTNDDDLARRAKHLTTTAKQPHPWEFFHDQIGFNYRLPNLNAALGYAQVERLLEVVARKRRIAKSYQEAFATMPQMHLLIEPEGARSNYWLNALVLDPEVDALRDMILKASHEAGYLTRPIWHPLHKLPIYRDCPRADLPIAESLARRTINLPSGAALSPDVKTS